MSYELKFLPLALKEWAKLGETVRVQLKKKLAQRLENPVVRQIPSRVFKPLQNQTPQLRLPFGEFLGRERSPRRLAPDLQMRLWI